ncbi:DUF6474 family protein [Corynebacterium sp. 335C]
MSFLGDILNRRRETSTKVKAAKAKAKAEAKLEAKLNKAKAKAAQKLEEKAYKQGQKDRAKEHRQELRATVKSDRKRAKLDAKAMKRAEKIRKNGAKQERKDLKAKRRHHEKLAANLLEQQRQSGLTKDKVNGWIGSGRVMVPVALPLLYRGITWLQNRDQDSQARTFGVTGSQAARFAGHGAPLRARIEAIRESLADLKKSGRTIPSGFVADADDRLDTLVSAVRNAEHMSPDQRRRAHRTISAELDGLDSEIMGHLGVRA